MIISFRSAPHSVLFDNYQTLKAVSPQRTINECIVLDGSAANICLKLNVTYLTNLTTIITKTDIVIMVQVNLS